MQRYACLTRVSYTFLWSIILGYLFFSEIWFIIFFLDLWFPILTYFNVHVNADFAVYVTRERRVESLVVCELSCFVWLIFSFFSSLVKCVASFSTMWLRFEWINLFVWHPFCDIHDLIRHDIQCWNKFLQFYTFLTPHSKQGSPWVFQLSAWEASWKIHFLFLIRAVFTWINSWPKLGRIHVHVNSYLHQNHFSSQYTTLKLISESVSLATGLLSQENSMPVSPSLYQRLIYRDWIGRFLRWRLKWATEIAYYSSCRYKHMIQCLGNHNLQVYICFTEES